MTTITKDSIIDDMRYLELLSSQFPTIADASTEIINLEAILNLPKGTEHFMTDIHGEYEAFLHALKNGSGSIKRKIEEVFDYSISSSTKKDLCTLIYYPEEKLKIIMQKDDEELTEWYRTTLNHLVKLLQSVSSKYTRSKVRKAMPKQFSYIIEELIHNTSPMPNKHTYVNAIFNTIISTGRASNFIITMCNLIQRLTIDSLHIVGDIYDRGPGAHIIMERLCSYHNFDIQWGNHDLLWMAAAAGNKAAIANVLRISLRYANTNTLEDGYGINLLPLATFALDTYCDDPCTQFYPKEQFFAKNKSGKERRLIAQMHKAIAIIQFKVEAEIIDRHPEYNMDGRKLLHLLDLERNLITIDGKEYELRDNLFPTIDPKAPYALSEEEQEVVNRICQSFASSDKLRRDMQCIYSKGGMYKVCNNNLLYHASMPLTKDGEFKVVELQGKKYSGRAYFDKCEELVRQGYFGDDDFEQTHYARDFMWYMWCGADSPLFDKSKMATFECYFLTDKGVREEKKGNYYILCDDVDICEKILNEFGIDSERSHIINGHVPVKTTKGEKPIKAGGKLLVIDGGFSKAYQPETGIAGYTLVYHSHGLQLAQHEPFLSQQKAIEEGADIKSATFVVEYNLERVLVKDTDIGVQLRRQICELEKLLVAYQMGLINEK